MRIIPKNTKVSTEFFKGVTLADMLVGFIGLLIVFLIAVSSLPYRGYVALGFVFVLVFLLVRIDDESNYMFFFRIIRHFSYFRSYRKQGFEYSETEFNEEIEVIDNDNVTAGESDEVYEEENIPEEAEITGKGVYAYGTDKAASEISFDISGDMLVLEKEVEIHMAEGQKDIEPFPTELKEEGFEMVDLHQEASDETLMEEITEVVAEQEQKRKGAQSVWKKIRNKPSKVKKGDS